MEPSTSADTSCVDQLFSRLRSGEFASRYWPNRHYVEHGEASRLTGLCSLPELESVDSLLAVARADVRVIFDGRRSEDQERYEEIGVQPRQALPLYRSGLSVCLASVDRWVPGVKSWIDKLAAELEVPRDLAMCNAYASRLGTGLAKHWDGHEVLIVQLRGSKLWRIAENRDVPWPTVNYVPSFGLPSELRRYCPSSLPTEMPDSSTEVEMRPGSVLFLPRGFWHATEATDEDSLSLTFSLSPLPWVDLVTEALAKRLVCKDRWREPAVGIASEGKGKQRTQELFSALASELVQEMSTLTLDDLYRSLEGAELVQCRPGVRIEIEAPTRSDPPKVHIVLSPEEAFEVETEPEWIGAFHWLNERKGTFRPGEFMDALPEIGRDTAEAILTTLENAGVLERAA